MKKEYSSPSSEVLFVEAVQFLAASGNEILNDLGINFGGTDTEGLLDPT